MRIFSRFSPRQIIPNRCERFGHQRVVNVIHSILLLCPSKASYMMKGISAPLINASTSARTTFAGTSPTKAVCTWRCESIKATCGRPSTPSFRAQKSFWRFLGSVEPTQGLLKALAFQHQWFSSIDIYIYIHILCPNIFDQKSLKRVEDIVRIGGGNSETHHFLLKPGAA